MLRFVNREEELAFLENLYEKTEKQAQLLVLYGKRRVGKTTTLRLVEKVPTKPISRSTLPIPPFGGKIKPRW